MLRLLIVPCVVALAALGAVPCARGQSFDRTTQVRLDRIERDLNMLERQVYRGPPTALGPPAAGGGGTSAADIEIRMERLEAQMRDLTGRVEEIANGLDQLKQRVEQINSDYDVRFNELAGTAGAAAGGAAGPAAPPARPGPPPAGLAGRVAAGVGPLPGSGALMPPGAAVPPPPASGGLNPIFNTLTPPGAGPASSPSLSPPPAEPANSEATLPRGSINEQFNHAFGLVKQADYPGAEAALKAFIEAHPSEPLAGNAQYWLGQTYFARNRYADAASAFAEGYKRFPKGSKAAEDLLYLGISLAKTDQKKNACLALAQIDQAFPSGAAAVKERASAEKKRLGCG